MSIDTGESEVAETEEALRSKVETWLTKQMPIIQMHGGTSAVRKAEPGGEVVVELGGGCRGCEISGITTGNIEAELLQWPEIEEITVRAPESGESLGVDQAESIMGVDRSEGGRGF